MKKPAKNQFDIHPIIKDRWSPRAFSPKPIENDKLQKIFEASRWAPSAYNNQPWRYLVGKRESETYQKLIDSMIEFNRNWAKNSPTLVLVIGKKTDEKNRNNPTYQYDTGQSIAYLTFQAMNEGLFVHQMSGFKKEKVIEFFEIDSEQYTPIAIFAIGYPGDLSILPDSIQKLESAERDRKSFDEFVFENKIGNKTNFFNQ